MSHVEDYVWYGLIHTHFGSILKAHNTMHDMHDSKMI